MTTFIECFSYVLGSKAANNLIKDLNRLKSDSNTKFTLHHTGTVGSCPTEGHGRVLAGRQLVKEALATRAFARWKFGVAVRLIVLVRAAADVCYAGRIAVGVGDDVSGPYPDHDKIAHPVLELVVDRGFVVAVHAIKQDRHGLFHVYPGPGAAVRHVLLARGEKAVTRRPPFPLFAVNGGRDQAPVDGGVARKRKRAARVRWSAARSRIKRPGINTHTLALPTSSVSRCAYITILINKIC